MSITDDFANILILIRLKLFYIPEDDNQNTLTFYTRTSKIFYMFESVDHAIILIQT